MATNVEKAEARIAKAAAELKAAKDRAAAIKQQIKSKVRTTDNKTNERKKYLVGALYLEKMKKDENFSKQTLADLERFLTRPTERAVFGFEPIKPKPGEQ